MRKLYYNAARGFTDAEPEPLEASVFKLTFESFFTIFTFLVQFFFHGSLFYAYPMCSKDWSCHNFKSITESNQKTTHQVTIRTEKYTNIIRYFLPKLNIMFLNSLIILFQQWLPKRFDRMIKPGNSTFRLSNTERLIQPDKVL